MLYAQISPASQYIRQLTPFTSETIVCEYMCASADPYPLGANAVSFRLSFGTVTFDENNQPTGFNPYVSTTQTLSGSQLSNWGTDDSVVLTELVQAIGCTVLQIIQF
jgi:hypothetical protein